VPYLRTAVQDWFPQEGGPTIRARASESFIGGALRRISLGLG
jgi:hypothetical protein